MKFKDRELTDVRVAGVDPADHPDYCDAYVESAVWADSGTELSDEELEQLNDSDLLGELVQEEVIDIAAGMADAALDASLEK